MPPGKLNSPRDFRRVMRSGIRQSGGLVILYVAPGDDGVRAGFVAGRGVGGAVARNRARRLLKEAWRSLSSGIRGGYDVVFVAGPLIQGATTPAVRFEMEGGLRRAGLLP